MEELKLVTAILAFAAAVLGFANSLLTFHRDTLRKQATEREEIEMTEKEIDI